MSSQRRFVGNNFMFIGLKCIMQKGVRLSSETCNMFKSNLSSIRHEARPQHLYLTRLNMEMSSVNEDRGIHPLIWIYRILGSSILSPGFVFQDLMVESATPTLSKTMIRACCNYFYHPFANRVIQIVVLLKMHYPCTCYLFLLYT